MSGNPLIPRPPRRGQCYPWLTLPDVESLEQIRQFDRDACARGQTQYLRQLHELEVQAMPSQAQQEVLDKRLNAVLVTHFGPDVRTRHYVEAEHTLWS